NRSTHNHIAAVRYVGASRDLPLLRRQNQRRSRKCFWNLAVGFDRLETCLFQPSGILRQRPALAFRRMRERVNRETQSKRRLGALFVEHEIVDDKDTAWPK